jgi:2-keto-4-pentenoate hydratase/2-oxohepta-3-ene-1,7-dioic acid hydratase in catechol pathway
MKLARALWRDGWRAGVVVDDDRAFAVLPDAIGTVDDIVRGGASALAGVATAVADAPVVPLAELTLGAPLTRLNRDVLCSGWNYWDHFEESRGRREGQEPEERPEHPTFFTKGPDTLIGPYDDIAFDPRISAKWDYEAEVALVIGLDGRSIPEERAWDHVFALFIANDVSQRDLQRAHGGQWLKGKSIDGTTPIGPWLTTTDEIADPADLRIELELNGARLQDASTGQMAFDVPRLISELSFGMTLRAGDILLTGTPSGVGNAREPQIFLQPGDELVTRVSSLGELRNRVGEVALA